MMNAKLIAIAIPVIAEEKNALSVAIQPQAYPASWKADCMPSGALFFHVFIKSSKSS